ncbi:hypothetical protein O181_111996, partial [Austropuccinia psidii MF-1]|nr:hypothetical protein [Austropuccinia psidii MF-1]
MYVSYHQDHWNTWLPLAEFAYNTAEHSSTKQSPVFTIYGRNPSFDSIHVSQRLSCWEGMNKTPISTASSQRRIRVRNKEVKE